MLGHYRQKKRLSELDSCVGKKNSWPFWTLSQSRKISSPPRTEPQVLSMREIFRLEALGDSAEETGRTFVSFISQHSQRKPVQVGWKPESVGLKQPSIILRLKDVELQAVSEQVSQIPELLHRRQRLLPSLSGWEPWLCRHCWRFKDGGFVRRSQFIVTICLGFTSSVRPPLHHLIQLAPGRDQLTASFFSFSECQCYKGWRYI